MAELWLYWQEHPPVHLTLRALVGALGGGGGGASAKSPRAAASSGTDPAQQMAQLAGMFGPPTHKFRPPCRMQTSAPDTPES
ncbi:MAG: hypothetical protein RJA98_1077 [Pseudomonadota bacterium]